MSNSTLVDYVRFSPNHSGKRKHKIDTITIHCVAGNMSVEQAGEWFAKESTAASCNYVIGTDGRIGLIVDESNRSWCTSSGSNDNRAITIEVSNTVAREPWPVSDKAYESLIKLLVDICKRNKIPKLLWQADKRLIGQVEKQNMTVHRWFANKACLPLDTELFVMNDGWKKLKDITLGEQVVCANPDDDFNLEYSEVVDIIEPYKNIVMGLYGMKATQDHEIFFKTNGEIKKKTITESLEYSVDAIPIPIFDTGKTDFVAVEDDIQSASQEYVSCVTVRTGAIVIRQPNRWDYRYFVVGNCPGEYLYSRHGKIAAEVNRRLGVEEDMTGEQIIAALSNKEAYELLQKAQAYANTLSEPAWSKKEGHWGNAVKEGIINGGNPEGLLKRDELIAVMGRKKLL